MILPRMVRVNRETICYVLEQGLGNLTGEKLREIRIVANAVASIITIRNSVPRNFDYRGFSVFFTCWTYRGTKLFLLYK